MTGASLAGLLAATPHASATPTAPIAPPSPSARPAPGQQAPADRLTIGVQPASATAPDTRPHYTLSMRPRQVVIEHLAVFNYSIKPVTVALRALDAHTDATGSFSVLSGAQPRDAASWVAFGSKTLRLPARSRAIVAFQVGTPYNALPGDHTAAVVVSLETASQSKSSRQIEVENQVGMRLYIRIAGPLRPQLAVSGLVTRFGGGTSPTGRGDVDVHYRLTNTGNVRLGARQVVNLGAWGFTIAQRSAGDIDEILPGSAVDVAVRFHHVPGLLRDSATVDLQPLRMKGDPGDLLAHQQTHKAFWAIPWLLLLGIAAAFGTWRWVRRRLRRLSAPGRHAARRQASRSSERQEVMA